MKGIVAKSVVIMLCIFLLAVPMVGNVQAASCSLSNDSMSLYSAFGYHVIDTYVSDYYDPVNSDVLLITYGYVYLYETNSCTLINRTFIEGREDLATGAELEVEGQTRSFHTYTTYDDEDQDCASTTDYLGAVEVDIYTTITEQYFTRAAVFNVFRLNGSRFDRFSNYIYASDIS